MYVKQEDGILNLTIAFRVMAMKRMLSTGSNFRNFVHESMRLSYLAIYSDIYKAFGMQKLVCVCLTEHVKLCKLHN